jgi:glutamate synthase domain-containing protein 2
LLDFLFNSLLFLAGLFIFLLGLGVLALVVLYVLDVNQTKQAIRHNYPVIGRLRYLFEHLGVFFRQYFFAMDREEMPFNREQRNWIYRAAKGITNTQPFGSTNNARAPGAFLFANGAYPPLQEEISAARPLEIGPGCRNPYVATSFFNISGMSFGSISEAAVRALSGGAKMANCWLNTGEGGLAPAHLEGGCDLVFQIGTAKYGVRDDQGALDDKRLAELAALPQVVMFEIKLSQGAKPGKGGILPGVKVTDQIAAIRGIPAGLDSISPNRHLEAANDGELLNLIARVRDITGKPVGIKTVIGDQAWLDGFCDAIKERGEASAPDFITIDGGDGGSGAAPVSLMDYVGLPVTEALPLVVDRLEDRGLRERIKVIASGKLINAGDVAWALCCGADFVVSARGFMFSLGCIQAMQCHLNTCPTGVTTHDPDLQKGLDPADKSVRVANYVSNMIYSVSLIAHSCGVPHPRALTRQHCRLVQDDGRSRSLAEVYSGWRGR